MSAPRSQRSSARWLMVILLSAAACRLVYAYQLADSPSFWRHRWEQNDMHVFDQWASRVAAGDWLTDGAFHPQHAWHVALAESYVRLHPEALGQTGGDLAEASRRLWDRWYGGKRFHQEPLYPYLVAATYRLTGPNVAAVFAWQLAVGLMSIWLAWLVTRRAFGDTEGLVAAVLLAATGVVLAYELSLLRETLIICLGFTVTLLAQRALDEPTVNRGLAAGLACGFGMLLKLTFLPLAVGVMAALAWRARGMPGAIRAPWAAVAGLLVALAPAVARNVAVGAPVYGLSSVGAITFLLPNVSDAGGQQALRERVVRIMDGSEGRFVPAVAATLRSHSPGSLLRLAWRKVTGLFRLYEERENLSYHYMASHAPVLRWLPVASWMIIPIGLLALAGAWRDGRVGSLPLYLLVVTGLLPVLLFSQVSRFRLPLVAALMPFAAWAIVRLLRSYRLASACLLAGLAALGLLVERRTEASYRWPADIVIAYITYYEPAYQAAVSREDWSEAERLMRRAAAEESWCFGPTPAGAAPLDGLRCAQAMVEVHSRWAVALERVNRPIDAVSQRARAAELGQYVQQQLSAPAAAGD